MKPSNVLLDADGEPQLTDFGLARWLDGTELLTRSGEIIGTPAYMAPEQAEGRGREADGRADVYGLGALLYRVVTARHPFEGSESLPRLIARVATEDPPRPRLYEPRIPRDLETVILKAMAKRPDDRYATAGELADDLRRFLNDEPVRARRIGPLGRAWRWARRERGRARLLAAGGALLLLVAATLGGLAWVQREKRHGAEADRIRAEAASAASADRERLERERADELDTWELLRAARVRLALTGGERAEPIRGLLRDAAAVRNRLPASPTRGRIDLEIPTSLPGPG